jgi:hypothetical protein
MRVGEMKKKWLILVITQIIFVAMSEKVLAPPYSVVCVDPGHGGPGAWKYGPNGDDRGSHGPVYNLSEQWVNLQVGLELRDLITYSGGVGFPVIMTRWTEQAENLDWEEGYRYTMWQRVNRANYGTDGYGTLVTQFISCHHNGYYGIQGTEVWWSSQYMTDSSKARVRGYWRPAYQDSLLAMKSHLRLLDTWGYKDRCVTRCGGGSGSSFCCDETRLPPDERKFVLFNTVMPSGLSEASNLRDTTEELLFDNPNSGHADSEAVALYDGWYSHADNKGIAVVRNSYALGNGGKVVISDFSFCRDDDTVSSPYITCWLMSESYCLKAITPQIINGNEYTFHHWTHLGPTGAQMGEDWYLPEWPITVSAEFDYHRYIAYFSGGPYSAQVDTPNGWEIWRVDEQRTIAWDVSPGADSTTFVDVFLDRNGGNSGYPEKLADSIPGAYYWGWTWTVTPPCSNHCRIKVVAYDRAGNSAWDISNWDFSISASGNNNPVIDQGLHCKYAQTECNDCIKYGESFTLEVHAHDLDHDSMYYEWHCGAPPSGGHFSNGQNVMITPQNYVVYTAPILVKQELYDYLSVAVTDVRGGQNWASGGLWIYPPGFSCLCGDANNDGFYTPADISYLINYLFMGGPPPHEPILKADANNDCAVTPADISYLINYSFCGGPPPECCWIE